MRNDKRFWQRFSTINARFMSNASPTYAEACRRIKPRIAGMDVLEIACGTGQFTAPLASGAKSYLATDYSERMLAKAKRHAKAPGLSFSVQDATNLDFASGTEAGRGPVRADLRARHRRKKQAAHEIYTHDRAEGVPQLERHRVPGLSAVPGLQG